MPSNKLDYEKIVKAKWKENAKQVSQLLKDGDENTLAQVKTYSDRFDEPVEKVKGKILDDSLFANCFAKDPVRQTSHEKIAYEYLNKHIKILNNFCKLPQSGKNAVYLTDNGMFLKYFITNKRIGKALDFHWKTKDKMFYASHKYTKDSGGAQDNQFNEQAALLRKFKENSVHNEYLFIICDGKYYTENKIKHLKELTSDRSFVVRIEEVVSVVEKIISKGKK
ncbi:MAG: hypothetical protein LBV16_04865 [Elusimicrobiota bacterium]|jgi:hypothetical protein|nr:hypothetical protein [Elusimicrobiota bacterium]